MASTAAAPCPQLGDFQVLRELGRGGMGIVYEATQVSLRRRVALKVLSGSLGLTGKAVLRFQREAEAAAKLHHTNIVPIYATGEQDGTHYYAMELIDGPGLDQVIGQMRAQQALAPPRPRRAPPEPPPATVALPGAPTATPDNTPTADGTAGPDRTAPLAHPDAPPATASRGASVTLTASTPPGGGHFDALARLIAEVADALDYAHGQGVIHRDIKPSNLLWSPSGRLSISDFGLARVLEQPGMTVTGEFVGSPAYMSPEQITAGRVPVDRRTDIYSLGATLYELLTLQPPFTGVRRDQVLAQILQKEPRRPRGLNRKIPPDLETICLKALEKDPDKRYQSAGAMAADLRRYLNRFAIAARPVGPAGRALRWCRRHRALTAALAALLVVLAVAGGSLYHQRAYRAQVELQREMEAAELWAMNGDLVKAEEAVRRAELKGASTGWVRLARGQIAYWSEDYPKAIEHLKQAQALLPGNVTATALLAAATCDAGDFTAAEPVFNRLDTLYASGLILRRSVPATASA